MSKAVKGTLFTVIAGIAWGLSGTSGQYLMAHGISALVLTNIRLIIAGLLLVLLSYIKSKEQFLAFLKDQSSLFSLLLFSLFGLFLNQLAYLSAIQETNAGTATVLQYVCPVGILAYTCIKDKVAPTIAEIISNCDSRSIGSALYDTSGPLLGLVLCFNLCSLYHFTD